MYTKDEYQAKKAARLDYLLEAATKAAAESSAALDTAHTMAGAIPFGQPILIGHHSEKRDRNYRARIESRYRKGFELMEKAQYYEQRAAAVENNTAIMTDDPEATDKLAEKIAELKAQQVEMKRINAALRKGADFDSLPMSEENRNELLVIDRVQHYYNPRQRGFPPYALTNLSAKIRQAEKRHEQVKKQQAQQDTERTTADGARIEYTPTENRIRIYFGKRVPRETFETLRRHGYRVLRSAGEGAFSAYYNRTAKDYADSL